MRLVQKNYNSHLLQADRISLTLFTHLILCCYKTKCQIFVQVSSKILSMCCLQYSFINTTKYAYLCRIATWNTCRRYYCSNMRILLTDVTRYHSDVTVIMVIIISDMQTDRLAPPSEEIDMASWWQTFVSNCLVIK